MESKTFRGITVIKYGELQVLNHPIPKPGKNQILVQMKYAPINPSDLSNINGRYRTGQVPPFIPGFEGSGIIHVVEIGPECIVKHKVGDQVSVISNNGTWGEYALIASNKAISILEGNTLEEAASHYINPATVLTMIDHEIIPGGHKAVIHTAGASALGRMLIKELKNHGIVSVNLVRKDEYIEELKSIGADYVLNMTKPGFEEELKKIANEVSATLCFDAIGGEMTGKILAAIPKGGQVLVYGALDGPVIKNIQIGDILGQEKVIRGYYLTGVIRGYDEEKMRGLLKRCQERLKNTLSSKIQKLFKYEEINEALEFYGKNASKGKILLHP